MKADARVGGQRKRSDRRDVRNWCGRLNLQATNNGDQYILAAFYRAVAGQASDEFYAAIDRESSACLDDHKAVAAPTTEGEE